MSTYIFTHTSIFPEALKSADSMLHFLQIILLMNYLLLNLITASLKIQICNSILHDTSKICAHLW